MLGAVCHDLGKPATTAFIDGRIRSLDHEDQGVEPATALLDRLNIHSMQGFDVRREVLGIVAHHLKPGMFHKAQPPVGDAAFRRLAQKVDLELLARVARADCEGRGRWIRLLGDGLVRDPRARARRRACASRSAGQGPASPRARREARPRDRRAAERGLRAPARWQHHDVRGGVGADARVGEGEAAILKRMILERGRHLPRRILVALFLLVPVAVSAQSQEPIGPFVVDIRADFANHKDEPSVADSLGVTDANMPGHSLGLSGGVHFYPWHLGVVTFGVGGHVVIARGSQTLDSIDDASTTPGTTSPTVLRHFRTIDPEVSLNFGHRNGWSYISGGVGRSILYTEREDIPVSDPPGRRRFITVQAHGGSPTITWQSRSISGGIGR